MGKFYDGSRASDEAIAREHGQVREAEVYRVAGRSVAELRRQGHARVVQANRLDVKMLTIGIPGTLFLYPDRVRIVLPTDYALPTDGLNIRWPDDRLVQEARLINHKLYAALAYCRANRLNQVVIDSPNPRLGIIPTGKSYLDVRQALDDLAGVTTSVRVLGSYARGARG